MRVSRLLCKGKEEIRREEKRNGCMSVDSKSE